MNVDYTKGVVNHASLGLEIACTQPGKPTEAKWNEDRVLERVKQNGMWLSVFKPAEIPFDEAWNSGKINTYTSTLNPRVEISKKKVAGIGVPTKSQFTFRVPKNPDYYGVIYQLMGRESDMKTPLPIFHFIVRQGKFWLRWADIQNGKRKQLVYVDLGPIKWDSWYRIEVRFLLDYSRGWFDVYNNGHKIWGKRAYATCASSDKINLSYGVYGYPGINMYLNVAKVSLAALGLHEAEPAISTQLTFPDSQCKCCCEKCESCLSK